MHFPFDQPASPNDLRRHAALPTLRVHQKIIAQPSYSTAHLEEALEASRAAIGHSANFSPRRLGTGAAVALVRTPSNASSSFAASHGGASCGMDGERERSSPQYSRCSILAVTGLPLPLAMGLHAGTAPAGWSLRAGWSLFLVPCLYDRHSHCIPNAAIRVPCTTWTVAKEQDLLTFYAPSARCACPEIAGGSRSRIDCCTPIRPGFFPFENRIIIIIPKRLLRKGLGMCLHISTTNATTPPSLSPHREYRTEGNPLWRASHRGMFDRS